MNANHFYRGPLPSWDRTPISPEIVRWALHRMKWDGKSEERSRLLAHIGALMTMQTGDMQQMFAGTVDSQIEERYQAGLSVRLARMPTVLASAEVSHVF